MQWRELMKLSKNSEAWRFMWSHFQMQSSPSLVIKADYCRSTKLKTFSSYRKNPKLLNIVAYCWTKKIQSRSSTSASSYLCWKVDKTDVYMQKGNCYSTYTRCLKITEKVSFEIASEASYVYILSGQKLKKMPKMVNFSKFLETPKACGQTAQF